MEDELHLHRQYQTGARDHDQSTELAHTSGPRPGHRALSPPKTHESTMLKDNEEKVRLHFRSPRSNCTFTFFFYCISLSLSRREEECRVLHHRRGSSRNGGPARFAWFAFLAFLHKKVREVRSLAANHWIASPSCRPTAALPPFVLVFDFTQRETPLPIHRFSASRARRG